MAASVKSVKQSANTKKQAKQSAKETNTSPKKEKQMKKPVQQVSEDSVSTETFKKEMKIDKTWNDVPFNIDGNSEEQTITIDTSYAGMFDSSGNLKLRANNHISVFDVPATIISVKGNVLTVANSELAQHLGDNTGTVTLRKDPRFWKVVLTDATSGGENARGRYSGASPYQAANKALTEIYRRGADDDFKIEVGSRVGALEYIVEKTTVQTGGGKQETVEKEKEILHKGLVEKITKGKIDVRLDNGELLPWDAKNVYKIVNFSMKESTRGSTKRVHRYEGCRVKLKTPIEYDINNKSDSDASLNGGGSSSATDSPKMIKYYKNKLEKLTKEKLQPGNTSSEESSNSEEGTGCEEAPGIKEASNNKNPATTVEAKAPKKKSPKKTSQQVVAPAVM